MVVRYAIGVGLGAVVTFVLFFLMQAIIASNEANLEEGAKGKLLDFVRLQDDQEVETKQRKPKPPPPPACRVFGDDVVAFYPEVGRTNGARASR